jgi:hypothetical protein
MADAGPGHDRMIDVGNETDDHVRPGDFGVEGLLILEIEAEGRRPGAAAGQRRGLVRFKIADADLDVWTVEEIPDEGPGDETGAKYEKCLNGKPPYRERNRGISAGTDSAG